MLFYIITDDEGYNVTERGGDKGYTQEASGREETQAADIYHE
jgi:hypothetical protein